MNRPAAEAALLDASVEHLRSRLAIVEERVRAAVARRRATDGDPDDRFRGLYLTDLQVDAILDADRPPFWDPELDERPRELDRETEVHGSAAGRLRLPMVSRLFGLDAIDTEILIVALAPDLDPRFEQLYGYLHDDVTRRRASVGLALELCGVPPVSRAARARLSSMGPLVRGGLVLVEEADRPFLTRSLRVPDRVTSHLIGSDDLEADLAAVLHRVPERTVPAPWPILEHALAEGLSPIYLRDVGMASGMAMATSMVRASGRTGIAIDLARLVAAARPADLIGAAVRESRLRAGVIIAGPIELVVERFPDGLPLMTESGCPLVLAGERSWDPEWSGAVPLVLEVPHPSPEAQLAGWTAALDGDHVPGNGLAAIAPDFLRATRAFRLTPSQIARAARAGSLAAQAEGRTIQPQDLQAGARRQNAAGLERLARRVEPNAGWMDLVLPHDSRIQLGELAARARQRDRVLDEWRIGGGAGRGRGITALFAGESGTGKTLTAEVVAAELGLDLYVIDLATVVDKYIGETEKNLDRIFAEADRVNGVLLFDEADAIFGKRSEVRDARDRYANVEVAYLLQRMERFNGLAILTTNLRANLDEAFTRRIDAIVDFPMPEDQDRLAIWRMHLPPRLPQADDVDLEFLARRFRFSGGNIRNVCLMAAFLAADADQPVAMRDLIRGTEQEYRKLGRLTVEDEFGPYFAQMTAERAAT